jgi:hypothetical protein
MPQLPVRTSNAHSLPARAHAASFNVASNRSRVERGERFVTRDLFEASGIPIDRDHLFRAIATSLWTGGDGRPWVIRESAWLRSFLQADALTEITHAQDP